MICRVFPCTIIIRPQTVTPAYARACARELVLAAKAATTRSPMTRALQAPYSDKLTNQTIKPAGADSAVITLGDEECAVGNLGFEESKPCSTRSSLRAFSYLRARV